MTVACAVLSEGDKPDFDAARQYVEELTEKALCEAAGEGAIEDIIYMYPETLEEAKAALRTALEDFEQAVTGYHRQVTTLHLRNGDVIYLSGGLSWGDPPTELYESIEVLRYCGVLDAAGFSS